MTRTRTTVAAALLAGALLLTGCGSGGDGHDDHPLDEGGPADSSLKGFRSGVFTQVLLEKSGRFPHFGIVTKEQK
jgi:hypothetical protein